MQSGVQILDSADLLPVMSSKLREVTDVLQIRESAAFVLLRSHRWNKERYVVFSHFCFLLAMNGF